MKLWRIAQDQNDGYDTYDSAVVAADTEDAARRTFPDDYHEWGDDGKAHYNFGAKKLDDYHGWAYDLDRVTVEYIGDAAAHIQAGVVVASFNAGY